MKDIKFKITSWLIVIAGVLGFVPGLLPFRTSKLIVVEYATIAAVALWFIKNIWIKLFLLFCIFRVATGINQYSTLTLHLLTFVLVFYQVLTNKLNYDAEGSTKNERLVHLLNIICVVALIQSLMVILQRCGIWWVILPKGYDKAATALLFDNTLFPLFVFNPSLYTTSVTGLIGDTNTGAALLGMCLPAFFRKKWWMLIPIVGVAFLIMHALGGIVAGLAALFIFLILKFRKKSLWGIIPASIAFLIYVLKTENMQVLASGCGRFDVWKFYIAHLIPKRPIVGWGLGQGEFLWKIIQLETPEKTVAYYHSHNEFITLTAELGIIGLILVCGYFITTFRKLKDPIVICGLIACLMASMFIFSFHSAIGLILVVYMAMAEKCLQNNKL